ncbi:protein PAL OF QUIRKY-like isoform X2 [Coffea arabica]|uniref:Protein PAL OF QUIRKY-like isoform X2 n=1 Tax=Coffea arabica TaxID=13443 RepID=A0A6P6TFI5_COFAR|nr:uncharacterized protein LOC113700108 isoform X2 [Coffea arabica]
MDPPPPPPSSTATDPLPPLPTTPPKLRLMCSYGGHIVPRPQNKSLFYAGGETRIVALDRRTVCTSISALTAHLSRTLFGNRPFHLKYQLPNEDLDSLISVTTDDDLQIMLEEHDRISAVTSPTPSRIRLFLFPIKPESLGSALLDPKADSWFSDALNNTRIVQRGQSVDAAGLGQGLMGLDILGRSDCNAALENPAESMSNNGAEAKEISGAVPESLVLETSSSFGSTSSSISMSNAPAVGIHCEDGSVSLFERRLRVPSSASIDSVGSAGIQPKAGIHQEPYVQVASGVSSYSVETENYPPDPQSVIQMQKNVQLAGYQLSQQSEGKHHQYEVQYVQGDMRYMPQYQAGPSPLQSYYPLYQMPMLQQLHSSYAVNQPYPIYLVPVRPNQNYGVSVENTNVASSRPPLHPQAAMIPPVTYKEATTGQPVPESALKFYQTVPQATPAVSAPTTQGKKQFMELPELQHPSQTVVSAPVASSNYASEFDDDVAYTQIYKTQPSASALPLPYQTLMKGVNLMASESSSTQENMGIKHQTPSHPQ